MDATGSGHGAREKFDYPMWQKQVRVVSEALVHVLDPLPSETLTALAKTCFNDA